MRGKAAFLALVALALAVLVGAAVSAGPSEARIDKQTGTSAKLATTLRIWADRDRKPAVERVAGAWARTRGVEIQVVEKEFGQIRDDLGKVQAQNAPDVIVGAHDWTGELAANGLVLPLNPRKAVKSQIPKYALDAFSYGTGVSRLYGAPVALENVGLVVNTRLAKVPKTFADLEKQALAFKNKKAGNLAIAVQQGSGGDAYHMYPFFSGLCGYIFGRTKGGSLDPKKIGLSDAKFLKNTPTIDRWNRLGLINAKVDGDTARNAFIKGQAAFWITGPWSVDTLDKEGIRYTVVQVPKINCRSAPFLGVQGFMATKYAATHGVESAAKDLVGNYMLGSGAQATLASANDRYPANTQAGKRVSDRALKMFGAASKGGVPMPNIPQMASVWSELGGAWVKSTRGSGAVKARTAFSTAARNIRNKIG